jgi:putative transposase
MLCRQLYNTALEQRITAWQRCHVSVSRYQHEVELTDIWAEMPEYAAIHSHVLQDVLARLDRTSQAFFRRVQRGGRQAFRASKAASASTAAPTRRSATVPDSITAFWCCRRAGA